MCGKFYTAIEIYYRQHLIHGEMKVMHDPRQAILDQQGSLLSMIPLLGGLLKEKRVQVPYNVW